MSLSLDLQLERIDDAVVRESLEKIASVLRNNPFFYGNWRVYEEEFTAASTLVQIKHNLKFTPKDALLLFIEGDMNFYFRQDLFDKEYIYAFVGGPCRIRFLVGRLEVA